MMKNSAGPMAAVLSNLTDPRYQTKGQRWEGFQAGGGDVVEKEHVSLKGANLVWNDPAIDVTFTHDGGSIEATVFALGLPVDWEPFRSIRLDLSLGDQPVDLHFTVLGARGRLIARRTIAAGRRATLRVDLRDLPLAQSNRPPFQPTGVRIAAQWGDSWPTEGARLLAGGAWPATAANRPLHLRLRRVALERAPDNRRWPVADAYGQRIRGAWPTKIRGARHLRETIAGETQWLQTTPPPPDRDEYGGWTAGPRFAASGFFRVEQDANGCWWYVDPIGNPFWSIGTTGVRTTDNTRVTGREFLFRSLPDQHGRYAAAYGENTASQMQAAGALCIRFYHLNVLRKWGSLEVWRDRVIQRFRVWGFNTIANWSEEAMLRQRSIPYVRSLTTRLEHAPRVAQHMPDVWSARWRAMFEEHVAEQTARDRDNPWLLGYFCDNEMPWHTLADGRILDCPPEADARDAFCACMRTRYQSVKAFNRDFHTACVRWEDVRGLAPDAVPRADGPAHAVMLDFVGEYAERYFARVTAILKRHDPNHLYLGCRFVRNKPDHRICAAAGRHADVICVNCYALWPNRAEFLPWHTQCGHRPIQIGEHHMPLFTQRQLPPLYPAFTAAERRKMYRTFVYEWAMQPYALGCHWFQHADQHVTGRPTDGENQPVGFVDITDQPHPELVEAACDVTRQLHAWHAAATDTRT